MPFSVLFVCTGNVCRSPMAERLLRAHTQPQHDVDVRSAGTRALVGYEMDGPSALALREHGASSDGHVARQLDRAMIANADLILTAETAHRDAIVRADPMSFRRAFTIREFARLGAGFEAPPAQTSPGLREQVKKVAAQRGHADPPLRGEDEIADPFGAGPEIARLCVTQLSSAIDLVAKTLGLE